MHDFRVGKESPTPWYVICAVFFLAACSTQDPAFKEDVSRKAILKAGDATQQTEVTQNGDTTKSGDLIDVVDGEGPTVLIAGKDDIDEPILSGESSQIVGSTQSSFDASQHLQGERSIGIDGQRVDTFTLTRTYSSEQQNFLQITRADLMDSFTQGTSGTLATDHFTQGTASGVLDVLIVIDNSGSMSQEQNNLASKLEPLLSYVQDSDWRIGVVTTDASQGCMRDIINKSDANASTKFASAIQAGTSGSGNEMGIRMAVEGLKGECLSQPWLRQNSTVAVLIVSDEDNCSNGNSCSGQAWANESYLINHLGQIRTPGSDARVYGIFWHPSVASGQCSSAAYQAHIYAAAVSQTNGTWGTICDGNYTNTLQAISQNIGTILKNQFALAHTPTAGTTSVRVNGSTMASGWQVSGNVITFSQAPSEGAQIDISYEYGSTPIVDTFVLSQGAAADSMTVSVNGNVMPQTGYTFNAQQNAVVFGTTPSEGAAIAVSFKKNTPLLKTFTISNQALASSVQVEVSGQAEENFTYNNGDVTLATAPTDGALVSISYQKGLDPILSYPYVLAQGQSAIEVFDADTHEDIAASYNGSHVVIAAGAFQEGRVIHVIDPDEAQATFFEMWHDMGAPVVEGSASLTISGETCEDLDYNGSLIGIERCDVTDLAASEALLAYDYFGSPKTSFTMPASFFDTPHTLQVWEVRVDGQVFTEFIVQDNTIQITGDLEDTAGIEIKVTLVREG